MIRLLLLSDIHWLAVSNELDPDFVMRRAFLRDIEDFCKHNGAFEHILVSGDIADKGSREEYEKAFVFLKLLCEKTGCELDQVYVIPGNHDKNFNAESCALRQAIHSGLSNEASKTEDLFNDLLVHDFDTVRTLYKPFEEYHSFASKIDSSDYFMGRCLEEENTLPYDPDTDKLYRKFDLNELCGYKVSLYGMNTALISDWFDYNDEGKGHKLFLPQLSYNAVVETEGHINIVMLHHPLSHLVNADIISTVLDRNFVVQIFGHLHKPASYENNAIHIMSGAFQPPLQEPEDTNYFPIYNILELDVTSGAPQNKLNANLRVEKYNSESGEFEEVHEESKVFTVNLSKPHVDRWAEPAKKNQSDLPQGVTIRKVRIAFLQLPNQRHYINKMDQYDDNFSLSENCVRFLRRMEESGRMAELWSELNKK